MALSPLKRRLRRGADDVPPIEPGAIYRRVRPNNLVETARVLAVTTDNVGIPHVRVDIRVDGPHYARISQGQRLLSLDAFAADFTERVGSGDEGGGQVGR
jgi:hypothetical protein